MSRFVSLYLSTNFFSGKISELFHTRIPSKLDSHCFFSQIFFFLNRFYFLVFLFFLFFVYSTDVTPTGEREFMQFKYQPTLASTLEQCASFHSLFFCPEIPSSTNPYIFLIIAFENKTNK